MRTLEKVKISDKVSIKQLLENQGMMSINKTQDQVKLMEVWKSVNINNYPIKVVPLETTANERATRGIKTGKLKQLCSPKPLWVMPPDSGILTNSS